MYERFTDRARKIMQLANQEAKRFKHEYIGTEHILLGLLLEGSGVAAKVLKNLNIDSRKVRAEIEKIVVAGPDKEIVGKLPQTPRAKKVVEHAIDEARSLNHNYVGTEHVLLGLIREEEGVASQVLLNLDVTLARVRDEVLQLLGPNANPNVPVSSSGQGAPKTPALDAFGRDLTELARAGRLAPVIGRQDEITQLLVVLTCRTRANPLLVGSVGVGKTALVEGLAQLGVKENWPQALRDRRIVAVNLARIAMHPLEAEKFGSLFKAIFAEVRRAKNVILYLEDSSTWINAGGSWVGAYVVSMLSAALAGGELQCIGSTTPAAYEASQEKDSLLARHFQPVFVKPPSREETLAILRVRHISYENYHHVKIRADALEAAIDLSEQHLPGRALPGKAIELLDQAGAFVRLSKSPRPPETEELEHQIEQLTVEKEHAVAEMQFPKAAELRDQADRLKKQLNAVVLQWQESVPETYGIVDRATIAEAVEKMCKP